MKLRSLLRTLHRDMGYFIAGMTLVYTFSGIFLNHRFDFNPDYKIINTDFQTHIKPDTDINEQEIKKALRETGKDVIYKQHFITNQGKIKIFISNGEVVINPETGIGTMTYLQKRPVIFEMNFLHRSSIGSI